MSASVRPALLNVQKSSAYGMRCSIFLSSEANRRSLALAAKEHDFEHFFCKTAFYTSSSEWLTIAFRAEFELSRQGLAIDARRLRSTS